MKLQALAGLIFICCNAVWPGTIVVGKRGSTADLSLAVASAKHADTVLVFGGEYNIKNLEINRPITLIGEGWPVIDGFNSGELFIVNSSHVTIRGFHFRNTATGSMIDYAAVKVNRGHHVLVEGNRIENAFFGIHFSNSSQGIIRNNILNGDSKAEHQTGNGIHLWKCSRMLISGNRVEGHRDGIYFEFVTQSVVSDNRSETNLRYGLHFMFSNDDEYHHNLFINNGAGVAVMYSSRVTMEGNTFEHNWGPSSYGLLLKDIRDSRVTNNHYISNTVGIYMEGTSRTIFKTNEFDKNGWAVKLLASCDDNTFSENNFTNNTFDISTNGSLVLNKLTHNYWDKYSGYDLDQDGQGDVPYRPVNLYGMVVEKMPEAMMLWRSFFVFLLDQSEKALPVLTPENLRDDTPVTKPYDLRKSR